MKTKGITIWEKYAEKFVLVVAAAAALGFTAMQFIGRPNAVSTGSGTVAPHEVDRRLQERAEQLLSKLDNDAQPGLELKDPKPALDDLLAQRQRSLSPQATLRLPDLAVVPSPPGGAPQGKVAYPVPALPAPELVSLRQFTDTLGDGVVEEHPELKNLFASPTDPHDLTWATVRGEFNLAGLREQLAALPSSWTNDHPENMVDVVVERQELVGGRWTDSVTLDPIPGQATVRPRLAESLDAAAREDILGWLADPANQLAVIQPDFYALRNGEWDPNWSDAPVEVSPADKKRMKLKQLLSDRDRLLEELKSLGGKMEDEPSGGGPAGGAGAGKGGAGAGGGGGGGGTPSGRRTPQAKKRSAPGKGAGGGGFESGGAPSGGKPEDREPDSKVKDQKIKSLQNRIRALDSSIERTEDELRGLGGDVDEEEPGAVDPFAVLKGDRVRVWAHDLTAQPQRTYRYRMTMRVYNPFFGRKRSLVESQQVLAEAFCIDTPASDWSEPVTINTPLRVFITNATAGSGGPGRVIAEVYRFYDGTQWMETFSVAAGGAIGGRKPMKRQGEDASIEVDFTTGLFVLDIVERIGAGKGAVPEAGGDARVLLHDLQGGKPPLLRDPQADLRDPERDALKDKVPSSRPA